MDVFKQFEEALVIACGTFRSHAGEEQRAEECAAALIALRGLEWKPVAEMGEERNMKGAWGGCWQQNILGHWTWRIGSQVPDKTYAEMCGYTHFCRPILRTPPKREVE